MFETLGERLAAALKKISGRGVLRPEDVDAGLREVRMALLEADVNFKVVKDFIERVRARITGVEIAPGLTAPQQVIKAVNAELVDLLGGNSEGLRYGGTPTVVMLVGLHGSGSWPAATDTAPSSPRSTSAAPPPSTSCAPSPSARRWRSTQARAPWSRSPLPRYAKPSVSTTTW